MSEILTNIWINIQTFNYLNQDNLAIQNSDIEILKNCRQNFMVKPSLFFILTALLGRYRNTLWVSFKKYFVKNKISGNIYKENKNNLDKDPSLQKTQEIRFERKEINLESNTDDYNRVAISMSRKISSRRNKDQLQDLKINDFQNPTYREEYLSFFSRFMPKVKRLIYLKKISSKISNQDKVLKNGENYILKSKFIYFPFLIIFIYYLYDLLISYAALYIKFQPLIDEYYEQSLKNKK